MRIAFDLDDTLIPTTKKFSVGSSTLNFPANLVFKEALRSGAPELLRALCRQHEVWIYTTSLRRELNLKVWFKLWGVQITSVVNQQEHLQAVSGHHAYSRFSKAPGLFGIDLLIDDLPGVGIECTMQGCRSLILSPADDDWTDRVIAETRL